MKVLITGSHGQVGKHLVKLLSNRYDVIACNRDSCDISSWTDVLAVFNEIRPDVVVNAAAYTAVDLAEEQRELAFRVNEQGSLHLAKAAQQFDALLIHISTDYVFSGESLTSYCETDSTLPLSVYGTSKLAGENAITKYCPHSVIIRTAWVFSEFGNNFVKTMLRLGRTHKSLGIVADQLGGPTYAGDIAKLIQNILLQHDNRQSFKLGIYHYSGFPHVSWYQFAQEIFKQASEQKIILKKPILNALTTEEYPTKAARPKNSRLDCQKVQQQFGVQQSDWKFALTQLKPYID